MCLSLKYLPCKANIYNHHCHHSSLAFHSHVKPKQTSERALKCHFLGVEECLTPQCMLPDWGRNDIGTRTQEPICLRKTSSVCTGKITECRYVSSQRCYHIVWHGAYLLQEVVFCNALRQKPHSLDFGAKAQPSHLWLFTLFPCCQLYYCGAERHSKEAWGGCVLACVCVLVRGTLTGCGRFPVTFSRSIHSCDSALGSLWNHS